MLGLDAKTLIDIKRNRQYMAIKDQQQGWEVSRSQAVPSVTLLTWLYP